MKSFPGHGTTYCMVVLYREMTTCKMGDRKRIGYVQAQNQEFISVAFVTRQCAHYQCAPNFSFSLSFNVYARVLLFKGLQQKALGNRMPKCAFIALHPECAKMFRREMQITLFYGGCYCPHPLERRKLEANAMKRFAAGSYLLSCLVSYLLSCVNPSHWLLTSRNAQTIEPTIA